MKVFIVLCVLLYLAPPTLERKTIPKDLKDISKTIYTVSQDGLSYKILPKLLVDAAPILQDMIDLWHVLLRQPNLTITDALFRSKEHEVLGRLITISDKMTKLDDKVSAVSESIVTSLLETLPMVIKLETNLHDLQLIINQINFAHDQLRTYLIHGYKDTTDETTDVKLAEMTSASPSELRRNALKLGQLVREMSNEVMKRDSDPNLKMEEFTLLDFATWATGHAFNSLRSLTRRMNDMVLPYGFGTGVFDLITNVYGWNLSDSLELPI